MFNNKWDIVMTTVMCVLLMNGCAINKNMKEETKLNEEINKKIKEMERTSGPDTLLLLNQVTWKLFTENVDRCRGTIKKHFGFSMQESEIRPGMWFVTHVIKGSPAWKSGLNKRDKIIVSKEINNHLLIEIRRKNQIEQKIIHATWICDMYVSYIESEDMDAYLEDNKIFISSSLIGMTESDSEIAAIIAHEWSHSMDTECKDENRRYLPAVSPGIRVVGKYLLKELGRLGLIYIFKSAVTGDEKEWGRKSDNREAREYDRKRRMNESELNKLDCEGKADMLSLKLMKKAGFDAGAAVNLLERLSRIFKKTEDIETSYKLRKRAWDLRKIVNEGL